MKNFKRTKESTDGNHGYTYDDYGELKFVQCCEDGWIDLKDLEPDAEWFGPIQVIKRWNAAKVIDCVGVIEPVLDHIATGYKFLFKTTEFEATHWQPLAGMRKEK